MLAIVTNGDLLEPFQLFVVLDGAGVASVNRHRDIVGAVLVLGVVGGLRSCRVRYEVAVCLR